jgi:hypothetical protein
MVVQIRLWVTRRYAPRRAVKQSAPSDPLTRSLPVKGGARATIRLVGSLGLWRGQRWQVTSEGVKQND